MEIFLNKEDFTGIHSAYEEPINPEIVLETSELSVEQSVNKVIGYLDEHVRSL